ncbi:hypothetical protein [Photobacterium sp. 1_MG-2023]|uniref:hypothetical protein n=1 Tax=Photobacterium sp. 1_MG-2023 TaxID=3062646 RepID=UPI0026E40AF7|nr:hypothetical protein [Photobacterium sp. 1_MG-2023]MDO6708379.1 hypothetical protein [Photobacterium sp. 1_MG-2023]
MRSLFSPGQVAAGTFIGGPLAAIFLLKKNFEAIDAQKSAKNIVSLGCLLVVLFSFIVVLLPENFPGLIVPILMTIAAYHYTKNHFPLKEDIQNSETYQLQSGWFVFGISIGMLIAHFVLLYLIVALLDTMGMISL